MTTLKPPDSRPPALFIMGPTAAGKTALAVELVRRFPCEIISVDSAMVYCGMDIGTAKPDNATLCEAPHRLIDIRDPAQAYSAAEFREDALREMWAIHTKARIPLLVGGTMLYFRALQYGLSLLPSADPTVRAQLADECSKYGLNTLYQRLHTLDPVTAQRIHPHDTQRIMRALEVYAISGRTLSELSADERDEVFPFRIIKLIIAPSSRQVLHRRIEERFLIMLQQGLISEVEALYKRPDLSLDNPAIRAVGYRQVWEYLAGLHDYATMIKRSIVATRQFAKRQLTWLRSETDGIWLDSLAQNILQQTCDCLENARFFPR